MESAEDRSTEDIERKARVERLKRDLFGDLLTTAEVADILEVHPRTVGEYIRDGKLHAIQLGGSWRVSEDSLKTFVTGLYIQGAQSDIRAYTEFPHDQSLRDAAARRMEEEAVRAYDPPGERGGSRKKKRGGGASMYERFTEEARRVVVLAQNEARLLNHHYIGTEHLLLGLLAGAEGGGVALRALQVLGVPLERTRADVESMIGRGSAELLGHIPFTPRAKKVLELTLREALALGQKYIGSEHILLGLIREGEGVAAQVLHRQGLDLKTIRAVVLEVMSAGSEVNEPREEHAGPIESPGGASMFERFTDRARRVVVLAQEEARLLNHDYIGTEHLLIGLISEGEGVAFLALEQLGISLRNARQLTEKMVGRGNDPITGHIPFTSGASKTLELSLREALSLGHNYIGTEHILLGLVRAAEGVGADILQKLAGLSEVRKAVIRLMSGYTEKKVVGKESSATGSPESGYSRVERSGRTVKVPPSSKYTRVLKPKAKPATKSEAKAAAESKTKPAPVKRKTKAQAAKPKTKPAARRKRKS